MIWELIIFSAVALYLIYRWSMVRRGSFVKRGVPYDKQYSLLGSIKYLIFRKMSVFDSMIEVYNKSNAKIFGIFEFESPVFLIRDPELIKLITIKDFAHFVNHRPMLKNDSSLLSSSVFFMRDSKWKDMRSILTPAFTGSKMRQMFELMNQVAQNSMEYLNAGSLESNGIEIEFGDFCTRFSSDVVATTAFGLEVNSFQNKENKFYSLGTTVTKFTFWQTIKFILFARFGFIMKLLKVELFDRKHINYFMGLVLDAMKYRKEHGILRPDMINVLMEARGMIPSQTSRAHNREWNDVEIVAQSFGLFFAGFDTTVFLMCFVTHELMENPETQQKLFEEIKGVSKGLDGMPLTYEALQNMKFMDMVISETLRKWPPLTIIDRQCSKDVILEVDDARVEIKKGEAVLFPVAGIHRDPKYFENPSKFDPERFSEQNRDKIKPFTYLPFGMGPRNCVGSRFVLLEVKSFLFYLIRDFSIVPAKQSTIPMKLCKKSFQVRPENGFWLKLVSRS